jgi:CRP-like cAMP-binding protein
MYSKNAPAPANGPSLRDVFDRHALATRVRLDGQRWIYATGDADDSIYFIESGYVRLSMASAAGKDCLLAIYAEGEVFGELCFASGKRLDAATTMQPSLIRRIPRRDVLAEVVRIGAVEALLRHLAVRISERQMAVFDLITNDSEQRLAKVLLAFAEKLGTAEGPFLRLEQRISHEELSQIVGTTRPRITAFIQRFRTLGLLETDGRSMRVHRQRTIEFLARD